MWKRCGRCVAELETKLSSSQQQLVNQVHSYDQLMMEMNSLKAELKQLRDENDRLKSEPINSGLETEAVNYGKGDGDAGQLVNDVETLKAQTKKYRTEAESASVDAERFVGENEELKCKLQQSFDEVECLKQKLEAALTQLELVNQRPVETEATAADVDHRDGGAVAVDLSNCDAEVLDAVCSVSAAEPEPLLPTGSVYFTYTTLVGRVAQ